MGLIVKICGIKTPEIALVAWEMGADMIGLNFSNESKRHIDLKNAVNIYNEMQKKVSKPISLVGLFYKNSEEEIKEIISEIPFDYIQFVAHDEKIKWDSIQKLHKNILPQISVKEKITDEDLNSFKTDLVILDSYKQGLGGGSGNTFEWDNAKGITRKYLLAGGLNPSNVVRAVEALNPAGVDVASGVESSPGEKNKTLIKEFIKNAKRI